MPPAPAAQASSSKLKTKSGSTEARKKTSTKAVPDTALDIDSIFSKPAKSKTKLDAVISGKGKEKAKDDGGKTSKLATEGSGPERASKKKKKANKVEEDDTATTTKAEPTRVVEVVDTSIPKVREVVEPVKGKKRDKKAAEEDEMFADSRGTGPSKSLLSIYYPVS
jgi:hypothetical protein